MQKAHLYESIFLFNRGIDDAIAKDCGLDLNCPNEKVTLFELHRASLNAYFCSNIERTEERDVARFEKSRREFEINALDEVQVYRDLRAVEERRQAEGKPPKIRFFTEQEQREWERQYPKPPDESGSEPSRIGTVQP